MMYNLANDSLVLGTVNASLPREVDADTLVAVVRGEMEARPWRAHVIALFTEASLLVLEAFFRKHQISAQQAMICYDQWVRLTDPKPAVEQWLDERRRLENIAA